MQSVFIGSYLRS